MNLERDSARSGTKRQTTLQKNRSRMTSTVPILCLIQSMVVVTSPITVQAPPALAAITTMPAKNSRVSRSATSFRSNEIITMVVVRLSSTADRKNVNQLTIQSSWTLFLALIRSVISEKPSWASTSSTIVIAPIRKKMM